MTLTEREFKVLQLLKEEKTQAEVAQELGITQPAVSAFKRNATRKIKEADDLVRRARDLGLLLIMLALFFGWLLPGASAATPNPGHDASRIGAGTFDVGNFSFQNSLTVNGTVFFVNSTNGYVGVNTTNPAYVLDVNGNANIFQTLYTPQICLNGVCQTSWPGTTTGGVGNVSSSNGTSGYLARFTNSTNIATGSIYDNGTAVGVGTSTPRAALEVTGDIISKGTSWTARNNSIDNQWKGVAYGNGIFVAVATNGTGNRVMTSPDGVQWTTRTTPADNNWDGITYGNGIFVAVAQNGTGNRVMTSPDGTTWTSRTSAADNGWTGVTYGNGQFVAVSINLTNAVMTSPDGITWTNRTAASNNQWQSVTYGNGIFVAVAQNGTGNRVMTSPDGITWTNGTSAANNQWQSVTYGNGIFVAVAATGGNEVMISPDAITWTSEYITPQGYTSVTYGNGIFVAVGSSSGGGDYVASSTDGITWITKTPPKTNAWSSVTYGNGIFVAVAWTGTGNRVMTSGKTDTASVQNNNIYQGGMNIYGNVGINTTTPTAPLDVNGNATIRGALATSQLCLGGVCQTSWPGTGTGGTGNVSSTNGSAGYIARFTNSTNIATGTLYDNGTAVGIGTNTPSTALEVVGDITSTGTNWSVQTSPLSYQWTTAVYGNGQFVAIASNGSGVATSQDGKVWTARTAAANNQWYGITYGNGLYVATAVSGTGNQIMTSPDGITWTARTNPLDGYWYSITYGNGTFVAVNFDPSAGTNRAMTSPDGITWTLRTTPNTRYNSVTYGNGLFVAVALNGSGSHAMTSPDGITWTNRTTPDQLWYSVTYGNGMFVAVAQNGTGNRVMTSPDGITWTSRTSVSDTLWNSVTYGGGIFVAVAFSGTTSDVMTSPDGITWTLRTGATNGQWYGVTYGNGVFVAVDANGGAKAIMTSGKIISTIPPSNNVYQGGMNIYGNVGINTTSPTAPLDVVGNATIRGALATPQICLNGNCQTSWPTGLSTNITYGNGTLGYVPYFTNSTNENTSGIFWDSTNKRVGIGTNTPGEKLEVIGNIISTGTNWSTQVGANTDAYQSVTFGNGIFVAVNENDSAQGVMTSPDGINWASRTTPPGQWKGVAYGNGIFVAVSSNSSNDGVMTSPDGITWIARIPANNNAWSAITYGNGTFVAVACNGTNNIMTSPDGITWTNVNPGNTNCWQAVTYGNGIFVAVNSNASSSSTAAMSSMDGITWTNRTLPFAETWTAVTYGNGIFVTVHNDTAFPQVATSPDGITWTSRSAAVGEVWKALTYGEGLFVSTATSGSGDRVMTSPDGITWSKRVNPVDNNWSAIAYGNGIFVAVSRTGTSGKVMTSGKTKQTITPSNNLYQGGMKIYGNVGINTTSPTAPLDVNGNATIRGALAASQLCLGGVCQTSWPSGPSVNVTYSNGTSGYLARFTNGTNIATGALYDNGTAVGIGTTTPSAALEVEGDIISAGTTWTAHNSSASNSWFRVAYGNGMFVAVSYGLEGVGSEVMTSPDGIRWTNRTAAANNRWYGITYGNGLFVAVSTTGAGNRVMTSPDGITWTSRTSASNSGWDSVTYANGLFVAVSASGSGNDVMTSPDGITWTLQSNPADNWASVTYGNGQFVAVAPSNVFNQTMTSPDGITWTSHASASSNQWESVTYGNGLYVAVADSGSGNRVMTSPDGITWSNQTSAADDSWSSITYGQGLFVAVSSAAVMTSPDGITWTLHANAAGAAGRDVTYGNGIFVTVNSGSPGVMTSGKMQTNIVPSNNSIQGVMKIYGNVGINITTPGAPLDVNGNATIRGALATPQLCLNGNCQTSWPTGLSTNITYSNGTSGYLARFTNSTNVATGALYDNGTAIGIGTTTPGRSLDVAGDVSLNGSLLSNQAGGLYIGRTHVSENQLALDNTSFGTTWTAKASSKSWYGISVSSDGKYQTAVVNGGQIYISSDYGNTWTAKDSSRAWFTVSVSSDGKYQTAVTNGGQIYISSDYGNTWTAKDSSRSWTSVAVSSDGKYQTAVVYPGNIYISSDYGNTWKSTASSHSWSWIAVSSDGKYQTASAYGDHMYISADYGNTWTAKDSSRNWNAASMSNDGKYQTAAVYAGQIYTSSDYGNTWTAKDSNRSWNAVSMSGDGKYQTAVDFAPGKIYVSVDYGNSWTPEDSNRGWSAVSISSDGKYQAATDALAGPGFIYESYTNSYIYGGNLGINTTSPTAPLDVNGNATIRGALATSQLCLGGICQTSWPTGPSVNITYGNGTAGYIPYFTNSTNENTSGLYWDATNKRAGINTTSPSAPLDVNGNATIRGALATPQLCLNGNCQTSWPTGPSVNITYSNGTSGYIARFTNSTNTATGTIYDNGTAIGIGTTSLGQTLDVNGDVSIDGQLVSNQEGDLFFGRNRISENQIEIDNTSYGAIWTAKDSVRGWNSVSTSSNGKYTIAAVGASDYLYYSSDHGNTWTPVGSNRTWVSVSMSSGGQYMTAVADSDKIYISSDYGNTWTSKDSNRMWLGASISSDGKYQTAVADSDYLYVSTDYGNSWSPKSINNSGYSAVSVSSDGKYQAATGIGGDYIYESSDYGNTWTNRTASLTNIWEGISLSSSGKYQTAVDGAPGFIYVSSDYGNTWTAKGSNQTWTSVSISSNGKYQTAAAWPGFIYVSVDYGNTWTVTASNKSWTSVAVSSDGKYQYAAASSGHIYVSYTNSYIYGGNLGIGTSTPHEALSVNGNINATGGINSFAGIDLAESFSMQEQLVPGEIAALPLNDATGDNVVKATQGAAQLAIGVVSTSPGMTLNKPGLSNVTHLAIAGRVPVKVTGTVTPGDFITVSAVPGTGMAAQTPSYVVGRALTANTNGQIIMLIQPGYFSPQVNVKQELLGGRKGETYNTGLVVSNANADTTSILKQGNDAIVKLGTTNDVVVTLG